MTTEESLVETVIIYVEFCKELTHVPVFLRGSTVLCPAFLCIYAYFYECFCIFPFWFRRLSQQHFYCVLVSELARCWFATFPKPPWHFPALLLLSAFQGNSPGDTPTLPEAVPVAPSQLCWSGKLLCVLDVLPGLCWLLGGGGLAPGNDSKLRFKFGHWISLQIRPFNASGLTHELLDERNVYLAFSFCCFWLCSLWSEKRCSAGSFGDTEKSVTRRRMIKIPIAFYWKKMREFAFLDEMIGTWSVIDGWAQQGE